MSFIFRKSHRTTFILRFFLFLFRSLCIRPACLVEFLFLAHCFCFSQVIPIEPNLFFGVVFVQPGFTVILSPVCWIPLSSNCIVLRHGNLFCVFYRCGCFRHSPPLGPYLFAPSLSAFNRLTPFFFSIFPGLVPRISSGSNYPFLGSSRTSIMPRLCLLSPRRWRVKSVRELPSSVLHTTALAWPPASASAPGIAYVSGRHNGHSAPQWYTSNVWPVLVLSFLRNH